MPPFKNPADFLMKVLVDPSALQAKSLRKENKENHNEKSSVEYFSQMYKGRIERDVSEKLALEKIRYHTRAPLDFGAIKRERNAGFCTELSSLARRSWLFLIRNPKSVRF